MNARNGARNARINGNGSLNGTFNGLATCSIEGCTSKTHARQMCRRHYDSARRSELGDPETQDEVGVDQVWAELVYGPGPASPLADDELEAAWERHKDKVMATFLSPPYIAVRPWGFWRYEAGREEHVVAYPEDRFAGTVEERADLLDEHEMDPTVFLADNGYLTEREVDAIEAKALEASPRIGTDFEQVGSDGEDRSDQRAVKLWEAVEAALRR
jgi:hypothetical protein